MTRRSPAEARQDPIYAHMMPLDYATSPNEPEPLRWGGVLLIVAMYLLAAPPCGVLVGAHLSYLWWSLIPGRVPLSNLLSVCIGLIACVLVPVATWLLTWRFRQRSPELVFVVPCFGGLFVWILCCADPLGAVSAWLD